MVRPTTTIDRITAIGLVSIKIKRVLPLFGNYFIFLKEKKKVKVFTEVLTGQPLL